MNGKGHSSTLVQGHSDSTFSNFFFLETAKPIEAKFHLEPPWDGGMEVSTNCCHMTKIAAMPIYGLKNFKIFFSGTKRPMILKLGMRHWFHVCYQSCSNDDTGLTLTYFTARSNLVLFCFCMEKC